MNNQTQKYKFHVNGMHCNSCVLVIEDELGNLSNVKEVKANLKNCALEIEGNFGDKNLEQIAGELSDVIEKFNYSVTVDRRQSKKNLSDFKIAVPVALGFAILFFALQKIGLVDLVNFGNITYETVFVVGIIASLSSCMAVVGGLLLSMSATFAKNGDKTKPQVMFHFGRIVSFFVLGGIIGELGSTFTLSTSATFVLGLIIAFIMLILGINLLDTFYWVKKLQPSMPKFISKQAHRVSKLNHTLTPLLVGVSTFFLPCGFTQSMQLYTLTTGSFMKGGLTMLAFALGTLPVLALISFSSFSVQKSSKAGIFFKTAGLIVIMFALLNLFNSLRAAGLL